MAKTDSAFGMILSDSRVRLLRLLHERPRRTIAELCEATGLHQNTVREHLQKLIRRGYVVDEIEHRVVRGRPRLLYSAVTGAPGASSAVAKARAVEAARRGDLFRRFTHEAESAWGSEATHQLDALIEDLEDGGFEPRVNNPKLEVELTACSPPAATPEDRRVRCEVHVALMRGVLAEAGGPLIMACAAAAEQPIVCTVHLALARRE